MKDKEFDTIDLQLIAIECRMNQDYQDERADDYTAARFSTIEWREFEKRDAMQKGQLDHVSLDNTFISLEEYLDAEQTEEIPEPW